MIILLLIIGLGSLVAQVVFLLNLQQILSEIRKENRTVKPGNVWLLFIPLFNLIYPFILYPAISNAIKKEFASRKFDNTGSFGLELGIILASIAILAIIPFDMSRIAFGISYFAVWIAYWSKMHGYKVDLEITSTVRKKTQAANIELSMEGDLLDLTMVHKEQDEQRVPTFLIVLCILSFIGCVFTLLYSGSIFIAMNEVEKVYDSNSLFGLDETISKMLFWQKMSAFVFGGSSIICITGCIIMLFRRKIGFYLYLFGEIVPVGTMLFSYFYSKESTPGLYLGDISYAPSSFILILCGISGIFALLYAINYKELK